MGEAEMLSELTATNVIRKLQFDLCELIYLAGQNEQNEYTRERIMLDLCKIVSELESNFTMKDSIKYWREEIDAMKRSEMHETSDGTQ